MRVTFRSLNDGIDSIHVAAAQMERAQQQVQTGRRLHVPSDDPGAMQRVIQERGEIGTLDAYTRASDSAEARLSVLDNVMTDVVDKITEAMASATGARGTTANQAAREAISASLLGIRDSLLDDFNTTFRGTYLFGGSQANAKPYEQVAGVWTYQGDNAEVSVDVGRNRSVRVALDGEAIGQGADATNLFTEFDALIAAVQAGDNDAIGTGITALKRGFERAVQAQSRLGADQKGIAEQQETLAMLRVSSAKRVSKDEDADLVAAITQMNRAATAYQAALGAVGTAARQSLLDYIR